MNFPTDPMAQHNRLIEAVCADWREAGTVTRVTPRADVVLEISRQVNKQSQGGRVAQEAPASNHGD